MMTKLQTPAFPFDDYLAILVRLLETVQYSNANNDSQTRLQNLRYAYSEAVKHFSQPQHHVTSNVEPKLLQAILEMSATFSVFCYDKVSPQIMASLTIYLVYTIYMDDRSEADPLQEMAILCEDLLDGKQRKHPWWRLLNDHLTQILKHYGSFCSLTIIRSTIDFFEGCLIEHYNFQGFPGSHDYPYSLRRMTGIGPGFAAMLFPKTQFDEHTLFPEITSVITLAEPLILFFNDLISFYKEFGVADEQSGLINSYCHVDGISINQSLDRVAHDTIVRYQEMLDVFENKDPTVLAAVRGFFQGYLTWHLTNDRYRLNEVYERCGDSPNEVKFRHYYEEAIKVRDIDRKEWATPLLATAVEEQANKSRL